ncbi:L-2-hydroxyglutarate oxidase [Bdellovibrionota bacterium FG-1]
MTPHAPRHFDFVIIGGGIVGLTLARELIKRGQKTIAILEKESKLGVHSSGRNSGVLHAGIYYVSDSLKAQVCSKGSAKMQEYAKERGIPCKKLGKVIVAQREDLIPQIDVLFERSKANGIRIEKIDEKQLRELEPEARTHGVALFSPDTAVIDSKAVLAALETEITSAGVELIKDAEVIGIDSKSRQIFTKKGPIAYGYFFNCAGLHADKVAHWVNVGKKYRILPFKGIYRKLSPASAAKFRSSIYPVPDLNVPFLGVHITRSVHDEVMVGPTAIPAFGRENYTGFRGTTPHELPIMAWDLMSMMAKNPGGFRKMVFDELGKYRSSGYLKCLRELSPSITSSDILHSGKVGLRAQLMDEEKMKLEMDFIIENGPDSTHVLNAISPAFTSSMAFAEVILEKAGKAQ